MKKALILIMLITVLLSGCVSREDTFNEVMKNMDDLDQLKMVITIDDIPVLGTVTGTLTIDHDKQESLILGSRTFTYTENNITYYLKEHNETFYRFTEEVTQDNYFEIESFSNFNYDDFEYSGGYYVSKEVLGSNKTYYIKISNGYIDTMQFQIYSDGSLLDVELDFVNYGSATVTLPEYTILSPLEETLFDFTVAGFEYTETSTGYMIQSENITIEHELDEDFYTIIDENGSLQYYPETRYVFLDTNVSLDLSIYLSFEDNPVLSEEGFNVIDKLYLLK